MFKLYKSYHSFQYRGRYIEMKRIFSTILILLLIVSIWNPSSGIIKSTTNNWLDINWMYRKEITIDHGLVDADLVNFPILFHNISSNFSDHAQVDGDDFVFTASDGVTRYNHEIEYYNSTTGELIAWVNISSLSSTVDTFCYLYYGNPGCGSQQNVVGVWDSDFVMVQHLDGASAVEIDDSTFYNNDVADDGGNPVFNVFGKIGRCVDFDGDDYLDIPDSSSLDIDNEITITAWLYESNTDTEEVWLVKDDGTGSNYQCELYDGVSGDNKLLLQVDGTWTVGSTETVNNNWYYYGVVYDELNAYYYLNGSADGSPVMVKDMGAQINNADLRLGAFINGKWGFEDRVDEIRISDILRSGSWINTSYNTMNSPDIFLSVGGEEAHEDNTPPILEIHTPHWGCIYFIWGGTPCVFVPPFPFVTLIIGSIYVVANTSDNVGIKIVEFYIDDVLKGTATQPEPGYPRFYVWLWSGQTPLFQFNLKVVVRDYSGNEAIDTIKVWRVQVFP
jgi:hypothetical protein